MCVYVFVCVCVCIVSLQNYSAPHILQAWAESFLSFVSPRCLSVSPLLTRAHTIPDSGPKRKKARPRPSLEWQVFVTGRGASEVLCGRGDAGFTVY